MQIDWDYHMRLAQQGTPGLDPSAGSIIHFHHFRRWRESGIAYELRDCKYNEVNRTLLSTAYGTRKEYKDRCASLPPSTPPPPLHCPCTALLAASPCLGPPPQPLHPAYGARKQYKDRSASLSPSSHYPCTTPFAVFSCLTRPSRSCILLTILLTKPVCCPTPGAVALPHRYHHSC